MTSLSDDFFVATSCFQHRDGRIEEPRVYFSSAEDLNSHQVRELAALLLELAADIDGWVSQ